MSCYINGGIVKEMTVILKKEGDLVDALSKLGDYLDLNLYDMKILDNTVYFELSELYLKQQIVYFLEEIQSMHFPSFLDYEDKIRYIEEHIDEDLDYVLEHCDDLFQERFRMQDTFSINDSSFYLDVVCYVFYCDGPYEGGNFDGLLKYLHMMQKSIIQNPLRGTLCFGMNS